MTFSLTSFVLGATVGWFAALIVLTAIAVWLQLRDRKRRRQQAMDAACNELERGKA